MSTPRPLQQSLPGIGRIVRRFWPAIQRQRVGIAGALAALIAEMALRLLEPWPMKVVLDRVLAATPATTSGDRLDWLAAYDSLTLLTASALAVVAITGLRALAEYGSTVGFALVGNRVVTEIRADLYAHVQRLSLSFHNRARGGDLLLRVVGDAGVLRDVTVTALLPLLTNVVMLAGMFALMLWLQWQLALLSLVALPLFWIRTSRLSRRLREAARTQRQREGAMAAAAAESIGAMKAVHAFSLERMFTSTFTRDNVRSLSDGARTAKLAARLERTVDLFIAIATALVLWQGARLVLAGAMTIGDLVVFLAYLKNAYKPARDFAKYTTRLARAAAAGERILDILDREPEVRDRAGAIAAPPFRGSVRFENVTFGYEPGRPVLRGIDLAVRPGQRVAIVGESGSGKSTIASLLLRLYDPWEGRVVIDGGDVRDYTLESLRAQLAIVLQDPWLFALSIRENLACASPGSDPARIEEASRLANAHEFITALPNGYDTVIGERGVTLSNGERQRLALARAALRPAPILILDEPTTGLDAENAAAVMTAIDRLARGRTTFLITHDLRLASRAEVVLCLDAGHVVERGTPADLLGAGGRYAALFMHQMAGGRPRWPEWLDAHAR